MNKRLRVLFLCTGNSARSQMAEGFARHYGGDVLEVFSAGTQPTALHPLTVEVMGEVGLDVSCHYAKGLGDVPAEMDVVVTVCDQAAQTCPVFAGTPETRQWSLPDPAAVEGSLEARREAFRGVRDQIDELVRGLVAEMRGEGRAAALPQMRADSGADRRGCAFKERKGRRQRRVQR
jgi:arsenate reductase